MIQDTHRLRVHLHFFRYAHVRLVARLHIDLESATGSSAEALHAINVTVSLRRTIRFSNELRQFRCRLFAVGAAEPLYSLEALLEIREIE